MPVASHQIPLAYALNKVRSRGDCITIPVKVKMINPPTVFVEIADAGVLAFIG